MKKLDKYIFYMILFMNYIKFMSYIFIQIAQSCLFYDNFKFLVKIDSYK